MNAPAKSRRRWGCWAVIALLLLVIATLLFMLWWSQRPITPVNLTPPEREVVDAKLQSLGAGQAERPAADPPVTDLDRPYQPGGKTIRLTEREANGLLNASTDLGERIKIEFGRDAINAYLAVRLPDDSPIGAGRTVRMKGRVRVAMGDGGTPPVAMLEDLTVFGVSLPSAWIPLKGKNLIDEFSGGASKDAPGFLKGIKSLRVEPGAIVLEVRD